MLPQKIMPHPRTLTLECPGAHGESWPATSSSLPPPALQAVADGVDSLRRSGVAETQGLTARYKEGAVDASASVVTFSDMKCGHCQQLHGVMKELFRFMGPAAFAVEERFYPLDSGCNSEVPEELVDKTDGRCSAARALVCLKDHGSYATVRDLFFAQQQSLTGESVRRMVESTVGQGKKEVLACMKSAQSLALLREDVAYASQFDVHGTPVVLINGRLGNAAPPFLAAIIMAKGDPQHPAFASLPPPSPPHQHQH